MTENVFTRVKCYMKSQSFSVNDSWLSECIDYCISTNTKTNPEAVQKFVEEQFLLNDLRETNNINGCLPANLAQQKNTTLNGKYTLQLLKLYDISVSKFKQLEKIRNVSIDNIEATKEDKPQPWEPTGKRMLQLFLTDGVQEILGIEYKPIRVLNDSLYPGLKIMIIGPVTCRRGVILLEETNVSLKGGEVDDLLIPNALENVLAKALDMPVNPDPYNDTSNNRKAETPDDFEDDFNINLEEIEQIERSEGSISERRPTNLNQNPSIRSTICSNSTETSAINNFNQSNRNSGLQMNQGNRIPENINEFPIDDDDLIFEDFDMDDIYSPNFNEKNMPKAPTKPISNFTEPKPSTSSNALEFPDDDFDLADVDFDSGLPWSEPMEIPNKKNSENSEPLNKKPASFKNDSSFRPFSEEVTTGSKRSSCQLSPLPTSEPKVRCPQNTPKNSKVNRKITDFIGNTSSKDSPKEQLPPKICDYICDVLTKSLTDNPIRQTVRGKVTKIGKLSKKNLLWVLDGTIVDQTGSLDVDFSSQFMEKLLGLSVSEFAQQKKRIKTDPQMAEQLRKKLVDGEIRLQALDCLLELEMKKDAKPVVMSSSELNQDQKNAHNKRLRMLKSEKSNK